MDNNYINQQSPGHFPKTEHVHQAPPHSDHRVYQQSPQVHQQPQAVYQLHHGLQNQTQPAESEMTRHHNVTVSNHYLASTLHEMDTLHRALSESQTSTTGWSQDGGEHHQQNQLSAPGVQIQLSADQLDTHMVPMVPSTDAQDVFISSYVTIETSEVPSTEQATPPETNQAPEVAVECAMEEPQETKEEPFGGPLPPGLAYQKLPRKNSICVVADQWIPEGIRFGPVKGAFGIGPIHSNNMQSWELTLQGKVVGFLTPVEEEKAWTALVRCADTVDEQTAVVSQHCGQIYYTTTRQIQPGEELKVFYADDYRESCGFKQRLSDLKYHRELKSFECSICPAHSKTSKSMLRHMKMRHQEEEPCNINIIPSMIGPGTDQDNNQAVVGRDVPSTMTEIGRERNAQTRLWIVNAKHKCDDCYMEFPNEELMLKHKRDTHPERHQEEEHCTINGIPSVISPETDQDIDDNNQEVVSRDVPSMMTDGGGERERKTQTRHRRVKVIYKCDECYMEFPNEDIMLKHKRDRHLEQYQEEEHCTINISPSNISPETDRNIENNNQAIVGRDVSSITAGGSERKVQTRHSERKAQTRHSERKAQTRYSERKAQTRHTERKAHTRYSEIKAQTRHSERKAQTRHTERKAQTRHTERKAQTRHTERKAQTRYSDRKAQTRHRILLGKVEHKCDECCMAFPDEDIMLKHKKDRHPELSNKLKITLPKRKKTGMNTCKTCGYACLDAKALTEHLEKHKKLPFGCAECGSVYMKESKLLKHQQEKDLCTFRKNQQAAMKSLVRPTTKFTCQDCFFSAPNAEELGEHREKHKIDPFGCDVCGVVYKFKKDVVVHKHAKHGVPPLRKRRRYATSECPWSCQECNRSYFNLKALRAHQKSKHGKLSEPTFISNRVAPEGSLNLKCELCTASFTRTVELQEHMLGAHGIEGLSDEEESNSFNKVLILQDLTVNSSNSRRASTSTPEFNATIGPGANRCCICNLCVDSYTLLKCHMRQHHDLDPVTKTASHEQEVPTGSTELESNGSGSSEKSVLGEQVDMLGKPPDYYSDRYPFKCSQCEKRFATHVGMMNHLSKVHLGNSKYRCTVCSKGFTTKSHFRVHMQTHTKRRPFQCHQCPRSFSSEKACENHQSEHTDEKPYKCKKCAKWFKTKRLRTRHKKRIHGNQEKRYKCSFCEKRFITPAEHRDHERRHLGIRPFSCETCGKSFKDKVVRALHYNVHTREKPYACHLCNMAFSLQGTLTEHILSHTY